VILQGLTIAPSAQTWLAKAELPRLLHVFGPACNLVDENGNLLSVVLSSIGPQPFALVVRLEDDGQELPFDFGHHLSLDSSVSLEDGLLCIGPLVVETESAIRWSPRPPWSDIQPAALHKAAVLASTLLKDEASPASIAAKALGLRDYLLHEQVTMAWQVLSQGILAYDGTLCRVGAAQLAGLGPGLTPAGDDFLVGVLYGLWASWPPDVAARLAEDIVQEASARTTKLSAAWLKAAGAGEAGEIWHRLWRAAIEDDHRQLLVTCRRVLATGETSGADTLAGLVAVLDLLQAPDGTLAGFP
jgi:hypothetical protein